jgi:tetratricopeptide (TPR) repeat protein
MDLCRLDEAEASYRRALQIRPDYAEAHDNLCNLLIYTGTTEEGIIAFQKVFDLAPNDIGLVAAVMLAVHRYLAGEFLECRRLLSVSLLIMAKTDTKFEPPRAYWNLLDLLLRRNQKAKGITSTLTNMEALYVVGESHSLPAHGAVVSYRGRQMCCMAQWIVGCKQWHLGNGKANKYRHKFDLVMAGLPPRSTVLLNIGEIDCRPGEGISKVWGESPKDSPEKLLESVCHATSTTYLQYVAEIGARYGHRLVIGGVPAPNIPPGGLKPEAATQHAKLVRVFNETLKDLALSAKLDFLDVYTLTECGDGVTNGSWHIDTHHLLPEAVIEAFNRHCLLS